LYSKTVSDVGRTQRHHIGQLPLQGVFRPATAYFITNINL
jgi:hypothetical protein